MPYNEIMWECECGNIEHGDETPDECSKCHKVDSFTQLPEEIVEERRRDFFEDDEI